MNKETGRILVPILRNFVILFNCSIHAQASVLRVAQSYPEESELTIYYNIKLKSIPMVRDKQSLNFSASTNLYPKQYIHNSPSSNNF